MARSGEGGRRAAAGRRPAAWTGRAGVVATDLAATVFAATLLLTLSVAAPAGAQPYEVPLYHSTTGGKPNLLVYAGVGGGPLGPYLFDTGSRAMFATYGRWWPGHEHLVDVVGEYEITFASGTVYRYEMVRTDVSLGTMQGRTVVTVPGARIGRITDIDPATPKASFHDWAARVRRGRPPIASDRTYGNFGAGLDGGPNFGTVLAQMPLKKGLKRGFVVMSGGRAARRGKLVVGLTAEMIAGFRHRLPMARSGVRLPPPPGRTRGAPGYAKAQVAGTVVRLSRGGTVWRQAIPTVFDTGGGPGTWTYGAKVPESFVRGGAAYGPARRGTGFRLAYGDRPILAFAAGDAPADDILGFIADRPKDLRINPGILMFYTYDVLFDLDDGWIGLRPATPVAD